MKRSALDRLISGVGLALAGILVVAGGLLLWASTFISGQVHDQLAAQKITMPAASSYANFTAEDKAALDPFQNQEMTTGDQAKAFADHYILVHMNAASGGETYEEVSGEYIALTKDPNADPAAVKKLGDLRQTLFMGNTLRGMLLNAYAFGTMAKIAMIAAVAAFVGAVVLALLAFLGMRHASGTDADALVGKPVTTTTA